jgi:hypothetical protein
LGEWGAGKGRRAKEARELSRKLGEGGTAERGMGKESREGINQEIGRRENRGKGEGEGKKRIDQEVGRRWGREGEKGEGNKRINQEVGRRGSREMAKKTRELTKN